MTQTLHSTTPNVYEALCGLVKTACAEQGEPTAFFDFDVFGYEPARYVIITGVSQHRFEWESIGAFAQKEHYTIAGYVTIFTGDSPAENSTLALEVLKKTYELFDSAVMQPVMSNRNAPVLGNTYSPAGAVYLMLPAGAAYNAGPGTVDENPWGWMSRLDFAFDFSAIVTPE